MGTLGKELGREREMRGIPLQEIARQTKINIHYLAALEADRLDLLPGEFFIKGTIRAYARSIGLDENQALNLYHRSRLRPSQDPPASKKEAVLKMTPGRWKKLGLMVLPLILLAAVLLFFRPWADNGGTGAAPAGPRIAATKTGTEAEAPSVTPPAEERPPAAPAAGFALQLTFRDIVWIRIQPDDGPAEEHLMQPGERKAVAAREKIVMRLGRPDQVEMTINGLSAKPFPASASAQTYEINRDNYRSYLAE